MIRPSVLVVEDDAALRQFLVTALAAHGYGLAWHEQLAEKDDNG